jgi:5-methylcytosine-specific restriction endonuclease McrA
MTNLYSWNDWNTATPAQRKAFLAKVKGEDKARKKAGKPSIAKTIPKTKAQTKAAKRKAYIAKVQANPVFKGDVTSSEFLKSYEWRKLRMQALKKYGPVCMCCGATPSTGAVINVDHIKPRKLFPDLALDINNLQILCHECNHGKGNWDQTDWR